MKAAGLLLVIVFLQSSLHAQVSEGVPGAKKLGTQSTTAASPASKDLPTVKEPTQQAITQPVKELDAAENQSMKPFISKYADPAVLTATGWKIYELSNTVTPADVQAKFGVRKPVATSISKAAKSNTIRRSGVYVGTAGAVMVVIQAFDDGSTKLLHKDANKDATWLSKNALTIAVIAAGLVTLLFIKLQKSVFINRRK